MSFPVWSCLSLGRSVMSCMVLYEPLSISVMLCHVLYGPTYRLQPESLSINVMFCHAWYGPLFRIQAELEKVVSAEQHHSKRASHRNHTSWLTNFLHRFHIDGLRKFPHLSNILQSECIAIQWNNHVLTYHSSSNSTFRCSIYKSNPSCCYGTTI